MDHPKNLLHIYRIQGLLNRWAGHILVVGMLACLAGVVSVVFAHLIPYWHTGFFPFFAAVLALEGMLSEYRTHNRIDLNLSVGGYILIEWVLILLSLRLISYLGMGIDGFLSSLQSLLQAAQQGAFLETLFDITYLLSLVPVIAIWALARSYSADLRSLQNEEVLISIEDNAIISDRAAIRQQITSRFLMTGMLLVILSGAIQLNYDPVSAAAFPSLPTQSAGPQPGGFWLLAYFVQGLLLLSLAHQSALRAAWAWERIPIDERIARRWIGLSVFLVFLVGLVALTLPSSYTFGLAATFNYIVGWLITIIYGLFFLLLLPLFVVITQFMRLIGMTPTDYIPEPQTPIPPSTPVAGQTTPEWLALLQSVLFWLLIITIVLYALIMYVRQNQTLLGIFRRARGWRLLLQAARWLRDQLRGASRTVKSLVTSSRQRLADLLSRTRTTVPGMPALRLGSLDARQQVRFYYLALLRRGADSGHPRRPSETPSEYAGDLAASLIQDAHTRPSSSPRLLEMEEAAVEIATLTAAFNEARYTKHPVEAEQVHLVRRAWSHLRRVLRRTHKREGPL